MTTAYEKNMSAKAAGMFLLKTKKAPAELEVQGAFWR